MSRSVLHHVHSVAQEAATRAVAVDLSCGSHFIRRTRRLPSYRMIPRLRPRAGWAVTAAAPPQEQGGRAVCPIGVEGARRLRCLVWWVGGVALLLTAADKWGTSENTVGKNAFI